MTKHTYIIVRHGFSLANESKTIVSDPVNGVLPKYALSEKGKSQSRDWALKLRGQLLGDAMAATRPIYVVSSPFSRAVQTAGIFLEVLGTKEEIKNGEGSSPVKGSSSAAATKGSDGKASTSSASATSTPPSTTGTSPVNGLRIINKHLKPDVAYELSERNFGEYELTSDTNYANVWAEDKLSEHANSKRVEPLASVWARVSTLLNRLEMAIDQPATILLVSHGDTLQITQTAFSGKCLTEHRSLQHLSQAEWRVLPPPPTKTGYNAAVLKVKPQISKL